jgi:hypothetical protein
VRTESVTPGVEVLDRPQVAVFRSLISSPKTMPRRGKGIPAAIAKKTAVTMREISAFV